MRVDPPQGDLRTTREQGAQPVIGLHSASVESIRGGRRCATVSLGPKRADDLVRIEWQREAATRVSAHRRQLSASKIHHRISGSPVITIAYSAEFVYEKVHGQYPCVEGNRSQVNQAGDRRMPEKPRVLGECWPVHC